MSDLFSRRFVCRQTVKTAIGLAVAGILHKIKPSLSQVEHHSDRSMEQIIGKLQEQIPQWMKQEQIPGLALAVIHQKKVFWHDSFGVKKIGSQQPVDDRTIFAGASLSKPLFAYQVLKLVERGKLNLDVPLIKYTAEPYIRDPRLKLITTRQVLAHTTGFPNWSGDLPVWIETTPGTRFGYSGEGFLYLQQAIEEITRQPFADYIIAELLLPLGMDSSSYVWRSIYRDLAVSGHDRDLNSTPMRQPQTGSSAGSLRTTALEYARFMTAMMQSGKIDSYLLTESSIQEMLRSQIQLNYYLDWGLGWGLEYSQGNKYFWHWGDAAIYKTFAIASRELGTGVVILTNSQNGLKVCPAIVSAVMSGKRRALEFSEIEY